MDARLVASELLAEGVIVNAVTPTALRLALSLLIDDHQIAEGVDAIAAVVARHLDPEATS